MRRSATVARQRTAHRQNSHFSLEKRGEEGRERKGRGRERGVLNLCQMFGGRLLLGNQNPEAECSSVSSNERQEQSCKKHTPKMEMDFGAHSQGQLCKNVSHFFVITVRMSNYGQNVHLKGLSTHKKKCNSVIYSTLSKRDTWHNV